MYKEKTFWQSKKFIALILGLVGTAIQTRYGVPKEMTVDIGTAIVNSAIELVPMITAVFYIVTQGKVDQNLAKK